LIVPQANTMSKRGGREGLLLNGFSNAGIKCLSETLKKGKERSWDEIGILKSKKTLNQ